MAALLILILFKPSTTLNILSHPIIYFKPPLLFTFVKYILNLFIVGYSINGLVIFVVLNGVFGVLYLYSYILGINFILYAYDDNDFLVYY
jgi:hypothetical protein